MFPRETLHEESLITDEGESWVDPGCRLVLLYGEVRVPG